MFSIFSYRLLGLDIEKTFYFLTQPQVNNGRVFIIYILMVFDMKMVEMLTQMNVGDFFLNINQITKENPESLFIVPMHIIPAKGQQKKIKYSGDISAKKIQKCFIFCQFNDITIQQKKIILGGQSQYSIIFDNNGIALSKNKKEKD